MRENGIAAIVVSGFLMVGLPVFAAEPEEAEHAGTTAAPATMEHEGTMHEHGGHAVQAEPSAEQIRQTIQNHIQLVELEDGAFTIEDEISGATRTLSLVRVHERMGKTGQLYYSCTDMRDAETGELLDLDFDVEAGGEGQLELVDVRIHKVEEEARYTYDEEDNRIPRS